MASVSRIMADPSFDAVGPLKLTDVGHDLVYIATVQPLDRWHVPETPMMGADALGDCTLERLVTMMARLVNDMNQRRGDSVLSRRVRTVAFRAVRLKRPLSALRPCRKDLRNGNRGKRGTAAGISTRFDLAVVVLQIEVSANADGGDRDNKDRVSRQWHALPSALSRQ